MENSRKRHHVLSTHVYRTIFYDAIIIVVYIITYGCLVKPPFAYFLNGIVRLRQFFPVLFDFTRYVIVMRRNKLLCRYESACCEVFLQTTLSQNYYNGHAVFFAGNLTKLSPQIIQNIFFKKMQFFHILRRALKGYDLYKGLCANTSFFFMIFCLKFLLRKVV